MQSFECSIKQHVTIVNLSISEIFLDKRGTIFETPECRFCDVDGVSFTVMCNAYDSTIQFHVHSETPLLFACAIGDVDAINKNWYQYFRTNDIKPLCKDGKFVVTVTVKLETDLSVKTVSPSYIQLQTHEIVGNAEDSTDAKIVVGEEEIKIHRGFLSTISPVFKAMFAHNTKESKDGIVNIRDMDAAVVKESIDLLYGRSVEVKTIPQAIGILRFFEKYLIKGAIDRVESWVADYLNLEDFCAVIKHAWDHSSEKLQKRCRAFFRDNVHFALSKEYSQLPPSTIKSLSERDEFLDLSGLSIIWSS